MTASLDGSLVSSGVSRGVIQTATFVSDVSECVIPTPTSLCLRGGAVSSCLISVC